MYSPPKTSSRFRTPMRRILEDDNNNSPSPFPRTAQKDIEHVLQESAQKDIHINWMEGRNGQLSHERNFLKTNRTRSSSPQKLHKLQHENVQSNAYIGYMEKETSQHLDKIQGLKIKLKKSRTEISKLLKTNKDCTRHIQTREDEIEEILQELERCREKKKASEDRVLSLLKQHARDEQERADLVRANNGLHTDVKHASVILKEKDRTHAEDKEELRKLHAEFEYKSRQKKVQAEDNAYLEKENASLRTHLTEEMAKNKKMNGLEKKLKETTEEMDDLKQKLCDNTRAMADQKNINLELEAKLKEAKNMKMELNAKLEEAKNSNRELDAQPAEANTKLNEEQEGQLIQSTWYPGYEKLAKILEWLESLHPSISYEKEDDEKKRTLEERQEEALEEDEDFENTMVHSPSEPEEEEEANMGERKEEEDTNELTYQSSSIEREEEQIQDPGVDTDEEENEDRMPQPSDETEEPKEVKYRTYLHKHFCP